MIIDHQLHGNYFTEIINIMDIFTTQLRRIVPVPIKPATLKVKALLKDAASPKLKEDHDHLENHDYYFEKETMEDDHYHASQQEKKQQSSSKDKPMVNQPSNEEATQKSELKETKGKDKHLDLYA